MSTIRLWWVTFQGISPDFADNFYRGLLEGRVRDVRYRKYPTPKDGLELQIIMVVKKERL